MCAHSTFVYVTIDVVCSQYLHALFLRDSHLGSEYHGLQVRLYAQFDRTRLLPFLKSRLEVFLYLKFTSECLESIFFQNVSTFKHYINVKSGGNKLNCLNIGTSSLVDM